MRFGGSLFLGKVDLAEHFFRYGAIEGGGIVKLVDKRKTFFILQHIAQKGQPGESGGGILNQGVDLFKSFLSGMGADRIVDAVGIIVVRHGLPETV